MSIPASTGPGLTRREALAATALGVLTISQPEKLMASPPLPAPALFVSHGSPMVAVTNDDYTKGLAAWAARQARPKAIVVVSAHYESPVPIRITSGEKPETIHDFGGFPDALYKIQYPCPGEPDLAARLQILVKEAGWEARLEPQRGLDHGAWVPLRIMFPGADIPVVLVSLHAGRTPDELMRLGQALATLRTEGIMLLGSGGLVHNLRILKWGDEHAPVEAWADEFEQWAMEAVTNGDLDRLRTYAHALPSARMAVPTTEHFDPLLFTMGALRAGEKAVSVTEGFRYGTLSMRSFALGGV